RPLIIFDSFIRFHQQEENSATEMALIMSELRRLAHTGASVVVLHHKPKSDSSQYRGSSDIRAAVDVAYAISTDTNALGQNRVRFACFKNRFAAEVSLTLTPQLDPPNGTFVLDTSPLPDNDALAERLLEIISAHPGESVRQITDRIGVNRRRVAAALQEHDGNLWQSSVGLKNSRAYFVLGNPDADPPPACEVALSVVQLFPPRGRTTAPQT
ncbi:MAG: AAA family ATPase, partial [Acidobacteria bacterium]|nr:AAA family ATPase [Acidobacteriota bacterium]